MNEAPLTELVERRSRAWSWAWLAPIAALALGAVIWYQALLERGVEIHITFDHGAGLGPGDPVRYRGVEVGVVRDVELHPGLNGVRVEVALRPRAVDLAVEGSQFWIVRPQISMQGVSGLETLLGPRYIAVAPGERDSTAKRTFIGLSSPPFIYESRDDTLEIMLRASRRGSLVEGSPVYYRDIQVGEIHQARLAPDATHVEIGASIWPRYAPLVREESKFWEMSGVGVDVGLSGVTLRADSLQSIISGGVAFATPERRAGEHVEDGFAFDLAERPEDDWLEWRPSIDLNPPQR